MSRSTLTGSFILAVACLVCACAHSARAEAVLLFHETFNGYLPENGGAGFPTEDPENDPVNPGLPQISEGADEIWYGARFEAFDDGTVNQDLAVQKIPGSRPSPDPVGRAEDDAGLLFKISTTGLENVVLMFDWRNFATDSSDKIVVGYTTLDLDPFFDANRFADFFNHPSAGNGIMVGSTLPWWTNNWVELLRDNGSNWHSEMFGLPEDTAEVWVAFWVDNGEGDYIKIDNVKVTAHPMITVPEPASLRLAALCSLAGLSLFLRRR